MKTGKIIVFTSLGALGIASLFMMGASNANFGNFAGEHRANLAQIENYTDFTKQVKGTRMEGRISEEKFNEMKERHENRNVNREAIETAIQNHDFSAWQKLHEGMDILEKIDTKSKFEKLIEMHSIMQDARDNMDTAIEKADAIAKELGIERGMRQHTRQGMGKGMGRGNHQGGFGMNRE